jgi:hypothetical protein
LGIPGWDTHTEFCLEPPLNIPKSAELLQNSQSNQTQSPTPVNDVNYLDHWVVPSDYADENSSFTKQKTSEPVSTK